MSHAESIIYQHSTVVTPEEEFLLKKNHNILRQKHDVGEPNNGCNHLLVVNNLITWLTYQYLL